MPTAPVGPWLAQALERGLIAPARLAFANLPGAPAREVRAPAPPPDCSEREFQARVLELARACGWWAFHVFDSRRSAAGWPDLTLIRPPRLLLAELKAARGRVRPEQAAVLEMLRGVPGVEAHFWRPADWPAIAAALAAEGGAA